MSNGVAHPTDWLTQVRSTYRELQTQRSRSLPLWAYSLFYPVKVMLRALDEFRRNHGVTRAAGLAFVTLLALVPLSVVMFQMVTAMDFFAEKQQEILDGLFQFIIPTKSGDVQEFLLGTVGERSGSLTGSALSMLVVTCLLLLNTIESTFNAIWGVTRARPFIRRLVSYWTVLTMPLLLVALSFYLSAIARTWLTNAIGQVPFVYSACLYLLTIIPTWLGFTCAYLFVPYTRVRPRAALIGGMVAGTVWELSKLGYIIYSRTVFSNIENLYGPLSTIPVTLIWIYLSWLIVIFGAEVAFGAQFPDMPSREFADGDSEHPGYREYYTVRIMAAIARHYLAGQVARATSPALAIELEIPPEVLLPILDELRETGLVLQSDEEAWLPARSPESLTVQDILSATGHRQFGVPENVRDGVSAIMREHFGQVQTSLRNQLATLLLADLARTPDA